MKIILFLHGWGGNGDSFTPIEGYLSNFYKTISPSLPCPPDSVWTLNDYVSFVQKILAEAKVTKCHIIAHSFGARVAVLLAGNNPGLVEKMVITGGAGLKPRFNLLVWLRIRLHKLKKRLGLQGKGGSRDYRILTPAGKATFNNIIKRDLSPEISALTVPTLLITGQKDKSTPVYMAKRWARLCKTARYKIYKSCGHFAYLDDTARFIRDTGGFLNG